MAPPKSAYGVRTVRPSSELVVGRRRLALITRKAGRLAWALLLLDALGDTIEALGVRRLVGEEVGVD
jgi:hypothetical protein